MTTKIYPDRCTVADIIADVIWTDEGELRGTVTEAAQALKDSGRLTPTPTIIRTVEELEALDDDTFLMASDGNIYYAIGAKGRLLPSDIPAVVIRDGAGVRAARKVLEEA